MGNMHADEVDIDSSLVARLLAVQFPQWVDLPLSPVPSAGTDNAIYRLGDDLAVRFPRVAWATGQVDKEFLWLPRLAPHLPLAIPVPLALGQPGEGYPWSWSVGRWLEGENAQSRHIAEEGQAARDLADCGFKMMGPAFSVVPLPPGNKKGVTFTSKASKTSLSGYLCEWFMKQ